MLCGAGGGTGKTTITIPGRGVGRGWVEAVAASGKSSDIYVEVAGALTMR